MGTEHWYFLDVNPEPWAIGPVGYARRGGKMSAYVGRNDQLHHYKQAIKSAIQGQDPVMFEGKFELTIWFWRNQATYETAQARTHRKHEADATNLYKATEDALQGILYPNDKDNVHTEAWMVEQGPEVHGKVVVRIRPQHHAGLIALPPDTPVRIIDWANNAGKEDQASDMEWKGPDEHYTF